MRPTEKIIDYDALHHNVSHIKSVIGNAKFIAVIKANAYGHGSENIAKALETHVDLFAVSSLEEALVIREAGVNTGVLLLEGVFDKSEWASVQAHNFSVVIHTKEQLTYLANNRLSTPVDVWLKLNTGMNRLGFKQEEFIKAYQCLTTLDWVNKPIKLMSHLATADEPQSKALEMQYKQFQAVTQNLIGERTLANSAGVFAHDKLHFDWVRVGLALFGASPLSDIPARELNLKPVMQFLSKIIAIQNCEPSEFVGYKAAYQPETARRIAVVAAGYGDGYPRYLSSDAYVLVCGKKAPIVGYISMDLLTIDITDISDADIHSDVVLWGRDLPIEEVASFSDAISHDLLVRASLRKYRYPEYQPANIRYLQEISSSY